MSVLNNNLNITNLLYYDESTLSSIIFAYLYITKTSFRTSNEKKQEQKLEKYITDFKNQISKIISNNSEKNNKIKTKIMKFDKTILDKLSLEDYNFKEDFIFYIEHILEPRYKVIIFDNNSFFSYKSSSLFENVIIIYKNENKYFPVFSEDNTYVFNMKDPIVKLILSFIEEKEFISEVYDTLVTTTNKDTTFDMFILEDEDVIFEDFNDDLVVHYTNKSFIPKFSKEEQLVQIQNLLSANQIYNQSSKYLFDLIHNSNYPKMLKYKYDFIKTTNVNKSFEDYDVYLEEFAKYKKNFNNSYIKSVYCQDDDSLSKYDEKHLIVHHEDVIRNSFTNVIQKLNNDIVINDVDSCKQHYTKQDLDNIIKKHKLNIIGSKDKLCKQLLSINLLETGIIDYYKKTYTLKELKKRIGDLHQGPNTFDAYIKTLINNNKVEVNNIFTRSDLEHIANKHNVVLDENDGYESLMQINFLKKKEETHNVCEEEGILVDAFDVNPNKNSYHLETFRSIPEDKLFGNGFYYNGNKSTTDFETFDIANYLNILKSVDKYLPINCELHYFDGSIEKGKIKDVLQDKNILKISLESKKYIYYNLKNIHDNKFFLYTDLHDGYKYNKHDVNKNIYFEIHEYGYEEMIEFVSLGLYEYLLIFKPNLDSFNNINNILTHFNASIFDINKKDNDFIIDYISSKKDNQNTIINVKKDTTNSSVLKKSIYKFLQFSEENQSDLYKMALLQSMNYIEHIHSIYANEYRKNHNKLNVKISFTKNTDNFKDIVQRYQFESFQELQNYKKEISSTIDTNIDIELTIRKEESESYVNNLDRVIDTFDILLQDITMFMNSKHEKIFTTEMEYVNKVSKIEGSISPFNEFIQSDPTIVHDVLEQPDETIIVDSAFSKISQLVGIEVSHSEIQYIERQIIDKYIPILYKYYKNQKKKDLNKHEFELWKHFNTMVVYSSFVTLLSQYKYKIKTVFSKCSSIFSLHGFPLDDENNKSFTRYIACVMFTLFNKQNKYFQSENHIQSQIEAVIRLIFQLNPLFKQKFETLVHDKINDVELTKNIMKPYLNLNSIKNMKINSSHILLNRGMKLHNMMNYTIDLLLDKHNIMDIVCEKQKNIYTLESFDFDNIQYITLQDEHMLIAEETKTNSDEIVTKYIENFTEYFGLDFDQFRKTFLLKIEHNHASIINVNVLFNKLINANDFFEKHYVIFMDNLMQNSFNIIENIRSMFEKIETTLMQLFSINDIYTFLNISIDATKRTHFETFIRYLAEYINNTITRLNINNIDIEDLKSKSEILREEEKQKKLGRYNNLQDDEMFIVMELEKQIGIKIDYGNEEIVNEEIEYQQVLSQDDDEPE